jgi:hypothetical protein
VGTAPDGGAGRAADPGTGRIGPGFGTALGMLAGVGCGAGLLSSLIVASP